ncbi:cytochrome P450 monooxygenase pc-3 [Trametopsis cervina]|nr:cytochrome P450 monooxygenase pc-3 [Trametopsis cervina]
MPARRRFLVPQAIQLVSKQLAGVLYPSVLTASLLLVLRRRAPIQISSAVISLAALLTIPVYNVVRLKLRERSERKRAKMMGAPFPPRFEGESFGSVDILFKMMEQVQNGFLSEFFWAKMKAIGNTFELYVLWDRIYITSDANVVKHVLATEWQDFVKGEMFDSFMRSVLGTGVFNSDGDMWKFHRSMTRPFFTRDRITDFDIFDRHAEQAINKMKERLNEGYAVDFQDLIARFTLDSATSFLFGSCVSSLSSALPYPYNAPSHLKRPQSSTTHDFTSPHLSPADAFASAFAAAQDVIADRSRIGWVWPWRELWTDRTAAPMKVVDAYLTPIVERALERRREEKAAGLGGVGVEGKEEEIGEEETLLDHLVKFVDDPVILHDEVLNIMIAGRDTTAGMLTMAVYFLSQHPAVMARLRAEVLERVGPSRRPDYDDMREMKYLRAVINESMRLYPAVPWNLRYVTKDMLIPTDEPGKPVFIPAGTPLSYSVHCMHRRTDYWGPDAEEFDPDRFLDARVQKYLLPNPFIFLPFNAGPRICLGQQFAYNEMGFFLVRLVQAFEGVQFEEEAFEPSTRPPAVWRGDGEGKGREEGRKGVDRFWAKSHLTIYSRGGMWVRMTEASEQEEA